MDAAKKVVEHPCPTFTVEWLYLTPEIAKQLLATSVGNRGISKPLVDQLAREMATDFYFPTHQGMALDEQGRLRDGHHRCHAVVQSGCAIWILIARSLPATSCEVIDAGRPRSVRDVIRLGSVFCTDEKQRQQYEADAHSVSLRVAILRALEVIEHGEVGRSSVGQFNIEKTTYPFVEAFEKARGGQLRIMVPDLATGKKVYATGLHVATFIYAWEPYPEEIQTLIDRLAEGDYTFHPIVKQMSSLVMAMAVRRLAYQPSTGRRLTFRMLRMLAAYVSHERFDVVKAQYGKSLGYDFFRWAREARGMHFVPWDIEPAGPRQPAVYHLQRFARQVTMPDGTIPDGTVAEGYDDDDLDLDDLFKTTK